MLKFNSILLFSENPHALGDFYKKVFAIEPGWNEGGYMGFWLEQGSITIGPHDKVHGKNPNPERILINFETNDVEGEFKRIKELGAKVIAEPYNPGEEPDMKLATFEDPDGNFFQLATPFKM
jgi:predicted enzyme related to lactoylglutathione lyase